MRRRVLATAALAAAFPFTAIGMPMRHVVLLGDSVFDNGAYVGRGPAVVEQLRTVLPPGWRATLLAVDGAVTGDVPRQLHGLPPDASHLAITVGGNDALRHLPVLDEGARSMAEALDRLTNIREQFQRDYQAMLAAVLDHNLPTAVATIYDGRLPDSRRHRLAVTALGILNDVITREAFRRGLPLLDLRLLVAEDADYANPIEPSIQGGAKIAAATAELVTRHDFARACSEVFARPERRHLDVLSRGVVVR